MLSIQSQNLQGDMLLNTLNFRTSETSDGYSDFSGDTVKLYGSDNNLMASFDLQSLLTRNADAASWSPASEALTGGTGEDKKFS